MGCASTRSISDGDSFEVFLKYKFVSQLGSGASCQVHKACCKESGEEVAIKCIVKQEAKQMGRLDVVREASIMRSLDHDNICRLYETFEDPHIVYYVMEVFYGKKLFERLEADIVLEEVEAAQIGREMVAAVAYIHQKDIIHRDLKPENWMQCWSTPEANYKLINFSLADVCTTISELTQPCGTLHYVAPEVLRGRYGRAADMWAIGVVMFLMVYATYPFDGESCTAVMRSILGSEPDWSDSCYALSDSATDFLRKALAKDPLQRVTAEEALDHEWFSPQRRASLAGCPNMVPSSSSSGRRLSVMKKTRCSMTSLSLGGIVLTSDKVSKMELPSIKGPQGVCKRLSVSVTEELVRCCHGGDMTVYPATPEDGPERTSSGGVRHPCAVDEVNAAFLGGSPISMN